MPDTAAPARFRMCDFSVPEVMGTFYGDMQTQGFELACRTMVPDEWIHPDGRYVRIAHVAGITQIWFYPDGKSKPWTKDWRMAWSVGRTKFLSWLVRVGQEIEASRGEAS